MGRYKMLRPEQVAERALQNLINRIPQMTQNYAQSMQEFAADPSRQASYKAGVALWTAAMRDPEVRTAISQAIQRAKQKVFEKAQAVRQSTLQKAYA